MTRIGKLSMSAVLWSGCVDDHADHAVRAVDLTDPHERFVATVLADGPEHLVEIVPSVHLPRPGDGAVHIWMRIPRDATLEVGRSADGRPVFEYPPGTTLDRVETRGTGEQRRIVDVRGTSIDSYGEVRHHVYRPTRRDRRAALIGVQWRADDAAIHARAKDLLLDRLRIAGVRRGLKAIASKLDCDGCHAEDRSANERLDEHGLVARGTDGAGFFTPSTLLLGEIPLERYGSWDPNVSDPYVAVSCPDADPGRPAPVEGSHVRCPGDAVPRAALDLDGALRHGDAHARAYCDTWTALSAHLPDGLSPPAACATEQRAAREVR